LESASTCVISIDVSGKPVASRQQLVSHRQGRLNAVCLECAWSASTQARQMCEKTACRVPHSRTSIPAVSAERQRCHAGISVPDPGTQDLRVVRRVAWGLSSSPTWRPRHHCPDACFTQAVVGYACLAVDDALPMKHGRDVIAFVQDPDGHRIELIEHSVHDA
jgi:hypothetical protein